MQRRILLPMLIAAVGLTVPASASADPVIAAAGDIACAPGSPVTATTCAQQRTSDLIGTVKAVLPLGDEQYNEGALSAFNSVYKPTWGRFDFQAHPVVGNHEYGTSNANGYFDYFDGVGATTGRAGTRGKGWYPYTIGSWRILALNSECDRLPAGTCAVGGAEEKFVRSQLNAHAGTKCVLAYWHEPRFSLGSSTVKNAQAMAPIWNDLYDHNADVVLVAHKHSYQRSVPLGKTGALDSQRGIREFIVGTGGEDHAGNIAPSSTFPVYNNTAFGVLKLTLHAASFDFRFVHEPGSTFSDSGTNIPCH